jgi:transcriptional regulator with XRE-family HTH domain
MGETFGSAIREARKSAKIRFIELASKIGVEPTIWNEYEQDRRNPLLLGQEKLRLLSAALDLYYPILVKLAAEHEAAKIREAREWLEVVYGCKALQRRRGADG